MVKIRKPCFPAFLTSYIAASALSSKVSASVADSGYTAAPTLMPHDILWPLILKSSVIALMAFLATVAMSVGVLILSAIIVNSSPARRATVSEARTLFLIYWPFLTEQYHLLSGHSCH